MDHSELAERLNDKQAFDLLVNEAAEQPELINELLAIMQSDRGSLKFKAEKVIRAVSELQPDVLLPHFDLLASLTKSSNNFIKWGAIITLSNLFMADTEKKFEQHLPDYLALVESDNMITSANTVGNLWKLMHAYPDREKQITKLLLLVPEIVYLHKGSPSPECNRVVCGHVLDCFSRYFTVSGSQPEMLAFAESQLNSCRLALAKKAAAFLKHYYRV